MNNYSAPLGQTEMKEILRERATAVNNYLAAFAPMNTPERLLKAMRYSLEAGGKRLRPVLCISCAALCGLPEARVIPFAAAIEMIHTYSLIHDDLPAMDDDDLRRGKASCHKAFDEATAILAGDALLTDAFAVACLAQVQPDLLLTALHALAQAAGSGGMAGGQMLDMLYTGQPDVSCAQIMHMQRLKTGAMLRAACECGAILAGADAENLKNIADFGARLGKAFQVVDDILDLTGDTAILGKPVGSDVARGKNTCPAVLGIDASRKLAREEYEKACAALSGYNSEEARFLRALAEYIIQRQS